MEIAPEFRETLAAGGLNSFEAVMGTEFRRDQVKRWFPGRNTARLELPGLGTAVYVKRYGRDYLTGAKLLLRTVRWPSAQDESEREWKALRELRGLGFRVPNAVAFGKETVWGVSVRSFVVTEEIADGVPADRLLPQLRRTEKKGLLSEMTQVAQCLHRAGFVHKDLYLCHFFIVQNPEPQVYLIDLQRATRPRFIKRWLVKDLSAFAYSAAEAGASRTDLLRCYLQYCGKKRLDEEDRPTLQKIFRRVERYRSHQPRHPNQPPA